MTSTRPASFAAHLDPRVAMPRPLPIFASLTLLAAIYPTDALASEHRLAGHSDQPEAQAEAQLPEGLVAPRLLEPVSVIYPEALTKLDSPPSGTIVVRFVVGIDGKTKEHEIVTSVDPTLDAAAIAAIAGSTYEPATYQGQPVELVLSLAINVPAPAPAVEDIEPSAEATQSPPDDALPESTQEPVETVAAQEDSALLPERIAGVILEAGQRVPVANATIIAIPAGDLPVGYIKKKIYEAPIEPEWSYTAESGEDGRFTLRGVPDGKVRLVVQTDGFERIEYVVQLGAGEILDLKYFQPRQSDYPYRTTVRVERDIAVEISKRTISVEELTKLPGTQGDALKSLQNFPGVARAPFNAGQLIIRGAAPQDSRTYFGNHEIPQLFHFGGLSSTINSDVLTEIDFIPGNFDSRFGDAIGGIVNVAPRKGRRDGYHGYIDSDIIDTGVLAEGPVGKGSFIISGRRSYIDLILPAVLPKDSSINFTVAPRYWDYQTFLDYPVAGGNLSVRVFGSDDATKLLFTQENDDSADARNQAETRVGFHRADVNYERRFGSWNTLISGSYTRNFFDINFGGQFRFKLTNNVMSFRSEMSRTLTKRSKLRIGVEAQQYVFDIDVKAPPIPSDGVTQEGSLRRQKSSGDYFQPNFYTTLVLTPTKGIAIYPGARIGLYQLSDARGPLFYADPRIRASFQLTETTELKAATGMFTQMPPVEQRSKIFGNPQLGLEHAIHTSIAISQKLPWGIEAEGTLFHKHLYNLAAGSIDLIERDGSPAPSLYQNTAIGRVIGMEVLIRKPLTRNVFGWLSYTLMKSERKRVPSEQFVLFDQDQTHILTLVGSYKLPRNWQVGARFRLVSGNPTTPINDSVFDASSGENIAINGPRNGGRLPAFHQLDFRVDKGWVYKRAKATAYLDILNLYNANNVEFFRYSYDFRAKLPVSSLPIIPSLGFKLEF